MDVLELLPEKKRPQAPKSAKSQPAGIFIDGLSEVALEERGHEREIPHVGGTSSSIEERVRSLGDRGAEHLPQASQAFGLVAVGCTGSTAGQQGCG